MEQKNHLDFASFKKIETWYTRDKKEKIERNMKRENKTRKYEKGKKRRNHLKKKILARTNRPEIAHPTLDFLGLSLFPHKILRLGNNKYYFFKEKNRKKWKRENKTRNNDKRKKENEKEKEKEK
jgi:hypothetical protein